MAYRNVRQYPRYAVEAALEIATPERRLEGTTQNLSRGGLCAELSERIEPGTQVDLRISLIFDVETASESLLVAARVVWCTSMSGGHQLGMKFLAIDSEQRSYLEMFLRFLDEGRAAGAI